MALCNYLNSFILDNSSCYVHGVQLRIILLIRNSIQFRLCELFWSSVTILGHPHVFIVTSALVDYNTNSSCMRSTEVYVHIKLI